jgi:hypothetical protein
MSTNNTTMSNRGPGYYLFREVISLTLHDQEMSRVGISENDGIRPITGDELGMVFVTCNRIKLTMFDVVSPEGDTLTVTVHASNGDYVTVEDILNAFLENNKKWNAIAPIGEDGKPVPLPLAHVYFEGISDFGPDEVGLVSFGS